MRGRRLTIIGGSLLVVALCTWAVLAYGDRRATRGLCMHWAQRMLVDVAPAEYEVVRFRDLPADDLWGNTLRLKLTVSQFSARACVASSGPDGRRANSDDIWACSSDIDVGRAVASGFQSAGKHWGRGLVEGAMQGIQEAKAGTIAKVKAKLRRKDDG